VDIIEDLCHLAPYPLLLQLLRPNSHDSCAHESTSGLKFSCICGGHDSIHYFGVIVSPMHFSSCTPALFQCTQVSGTPLGDSEIAIISSSERSKNPSSLALPPLGPSLDNLVKISFAVIYLACSPPRPPKNWPFTYTLSSLIEHFVCPLRSSLFSLFPLWLTPKFPLGEVSRFVFFLDLLYR